MSGALTAAAYDPAQSHSLSILERLFPPPRPFTVTLWDGTELPASGSPVFCMKLNHAGSLRRMFTPPIELSLGEAFIYGDFDIEGDIFAAYALIERMAARQFSTKEMAGIVWQALALPKGGPERLHARGPARLRGRIHSRERDRAAVQYHYDVGNPFYSLWLDRNLQYSCAYFSSPTDDIDTAQQRKMEHICRKLHLKTGDRLLDIGCGWGGLAIYAATFHGAQSVGVSLSRNQVAHAQDWIARLGLGNRVRVELHDYRDLAAETFDKIVSVGMFEHVGKSHLPEYFGQAYRLLKPGGLFLNHGISHRVAPDTGRMPGASGSSLWERRIGQYLLGTGQFSQRFVFPDGELVPVSEANLVAEAAGFEVRDVENLREHYALTLRRWVERLEAHRAEAVQVADEATYRTWRLFMSASAYGFESGTISVNQSLLAKPAQGKINLPLTRDDLYANEAID